MLCTWSLLMKIIRIISHAKSSFWLLVFLPNLIKSEIFHLGRYLPQIVFFMEFQKELFIFFLGWDLLAHVKKIKRFLQLFHYFFENLWLWVTAWTLAYYDIWGRNMPFAISRKMIQSDLKKNVQLKCVQPNHFHI